MQKHRKRVCCPVFYSVRYQTRLILSVCSIMDVVHPLLWKQIPPRSPQLSLGPFFSVKEHSHMPLFWLQGVILPLPCLSSTALCPVLVIGTRSRAWHADLTLSQFVSLVFQCFVWRPTQISSLMKKCLDFEEFLCLHRFLLFLLFLSRPLFFLLLCPPLSRSQLNPSSLHSDSSAAPREEKRSEGCRWAEWWIIGLEKAGVGTAPAFTHLLPAPSHRGIVRFMVDNHNCSWKSPTRSVSPLSSCLSFTE